MSTWLTVRRAVGGVRTPAAGGDLEHSEFTLVGVTGNELQSAGAPVRLRFEMWYDLPNAHKEAVVDVTLVFEDASGRSFEKIVDAAVAP